MKSLVIPVLISVISSIGFTQVAYQASYEVMCRNKAKELAFLTYNNCMTDERSNQIEKIRTEYKDELLNLKSTYGEKLKKLSDAEPTTEAQSQLLPQSQPESEPQPGSNLETVPATTTEINTEITPTEEVSVVMDDTLVPAYASEAAMLNEPANEPANESMHDQSVPSEASHKETVQKDSQQDSMAVTLKPAPETQTKKLVKSNPKVTTKPNFKQSSSSKKSTVKAVKVAKPQPSNKKLTAKTAQSTKKTHALPEKKVKTQSIDLNTPSELAGTIGL